MTVIEDSIVVEVENLTNGPVSYSIPDLRVRREFNINEMKKVEAKELRALYYLPGGKDLIHNYLSVKSPDLLEEFDIDLEEVPEYNWSQADVKELLLDNNPNSLDRLRDALEFAPEGVIERIKAMAIELEISDINKREAIHKATGLNVNVAIENKPAVAQKAEVKTSRRVEVEKPARRVEYKEDKADLPEYKEDEKDLPEYKEDKADLPEYKVLDK